MKFFLKFLFIVIGVLSTLPQLSAQTIHEVTLKTENGFPIPDLQFKIKQSGNECYSGGSDSDGVIVFPVNCPIESEVFFYHASDERPLKKVLYSNLLITTELCIPEINLVEQKINDLGNRLEAKQEIIRSLEKDLKKAKEVTTIDKGTITELVKELEDEKSHFSILRGKFDDLEDKYIVIIEKNESLKMKFSELLNKFKELENEIKKLRPYKTSNIENVANTAVGLGIDQLYNKRGFQQGVKVEFLNERGRKTRDIGKIKSVRIEIKDMGDSLDFLFKAKLKDFNGNVHNIESQNVRSRTGCSGCIQPDFKLGNNIKDWIESHDENYRMQITLSQKFTLTKGTNPKYIKFVTFTIDVSKTNLFGNFKVDLHPEGTDKNTIIGTLSNSSDLSPSN